MPADDRDDPFAPPAEPCECWCLHCRRTFMSDRIWFQRVIGDRHGLDGFWMCPTPNCDGAGFSFDIFPTDPAHPANAGWVDDDEFDDEAADSFDNDDDDQPYDPHETKWRELDDLNAGVECEIDEGDEWKHGVSPADARVWSDDESDPDREWTDQEADYDAPDRRPRELDWSNRVEDDSMRNWNDDDIPF